jgi:hypothetical protein
MRRTLPEWRELCNPRPQDFLDLYVFEFSRDQQDEPISLGLDVLRVAKQTVDVGAIGRRSQFTSESRLPVEAVEDANRNHRDLLCCGDGVTLAHGLKRWQTPYGFSC